MIIYFLLFKHRIDSHNQIKKRRCEVKNIYIGAVDKYGHTDYFSGYGNEMIEKGLGSRASTGTNRMPVFSRER